MPGVGPAGGDPSSGLEDWRARSTLAVARPRGRAQVGGGSDLNLGLSEVLWSLLSGVLSVLGPALSLCLPQSTLPVEAQAAGGGVPLHLYHPFPQCGPGQGGLRAQRHTLTPGGRLPSPKGKLATLGSSGDFLHWSAT